MLIGIISDTHDQVHYIKKVVSELNSLGVELVIHCGDVVAPFTLPFFSKLRCQMKGVFGNNDGDRFRHAMIIEENKYKIKFEARFLSFRVDHRQVAVFHGDYDEIVDALVLSKKWDAVFHGHTHIASMKTVGNTLSLNPGSFLAETSEKVKGASYALYNTETNHAEIIKLKE